MDYHLSTDKPRESKRGEIANIHTILIQVPNVDLHRGMVLGSDDPVRGRTVGTKRKTQVSTNNSAITTMQSNKRTEAKLTTSWGRRGPPSYPPRSAW